MNRERKKKFVIFSIVIHLNVCEHNLCHMKPGDDIYIIYKGIEEKMYSG